MKRNRERVTDPGRHAAITSAAIIMLGLGIAHGAEEEAGGTEVDRYDPGQIITPDVDKSRWSCDYCAFETDSVFTLEGGFWYLTEDAYRFGDFTGLSESGVELLLEADYRQRDEDGGFLDFTARNLGLDSREVSLSTGTQGSYTVDIDLRYLPHRINDSGRSPFRESSGNNLVLPSGWVTASSTRDMTALAATSRRVEVDSMRRIAKAGIELLSGPDWNYGVNFTQHEREGTRLTGGSFLTNGAELPAPTDFTTSNVDAFMRFDKDAVNFSVGYNGSWFRNDHASLTWDNPFTPLVAGADQGRLALEPDNEFHQLNVGMGYRFTRDTRINVTSSVGRGSQNTAYVPITTNAMLSSATVPQNSLDGDITTSHIYMRLDSRLSEDINLQASYRFNDRENKSGRASYTQIVTDVYDGGTRTNVPYSHQRTEYGVNLSYRPGRVFRMRAGIDEKDIDRTFIEIEETETTSGWVELGYQPVDSLDFRLDLKESERKGRGTRYPGTYGDPENPLLRRYYLANLDRETTRFSVGYYPIPEIGLNASVDYQREDYPHSDIGLLEGRNRIQNLSLTYLPARSFSMTAFLSNENLWSRQAGSEDFSTADWFATNEDRNKTAGLSMEYLPSESQWTFAAYLAHSEFEGKTHVDATGSEPPFPDLVARMSRAEFSATRSFSKDTTLKLAYIRESLDTRDWQIDWIGQQSMASYLVTGQTSPDYSADVVALSLITRF